MSFLWYNNGTQTINMQSNEFQMLKELVSVQTDRLHDMQERILEQVTKTNGRVTKLEEETSTIRFITKNKYIVLLVIAALSGLSITEMMPMLLSFGF